MTTKHGSLSAREQALCDAIGKRDGAMRADLARWVAIPTGRNHAPGLDELRAIVCDRLRALGAAVEMVPGQPRPEWLYGGGRSGGGGFGGSGGSGGGGVIPPSAVARRERPGKPRVLIACHLDTVFDPAGDFREMTAAPDGRRAVGPGVVDMKGGVVIAVNALEALESLGADVSWTVILTSDEETGSYHSEQALRQEAKRHDFGICTEPALPDGGLVTERLGSGQFMIEARGKSAHVGRDFASGVNAVYVLARAIDYVAVMHRQGFGNWIVNVGPLEGGTATNVVPDLARAWGNVRFPDQRIAEFLAKRFDELPEFVLRHFLRLETAVPPRLIVHRSLNRPAKPLTSEVERLALEARGVAEALGQSLPFGKTGGVCDGNILQDSGLPTLDTLGVRGGGLHTHEEWIDLASLVDRCRLLTVFIARLTAGGGGE